MAKSPTASAKNVTGDSANYSKSKPQSAEYKAFETLLGSVLSVSKVDLNRRIEEDKREKRTSKVPASRVSVSPSKPT